MRSRSGLIPKEYVGFPYLTFEGVAGWYEPGPGVSETNFVSTFDFSEIPREVCINLGS